MPSNPTAAIPYAGGYNGKAGVAEFFAKLGAAVQIEVCEPREFVVQCDQVAVLGHEQGWAKPSGCRFTTGFCAVFLAQCHANVMQTRAGPSGMYGRPGAQESVIMRLRSIHAKAIPPVDLFAVENMSDVVVIAGPNGVGKTRLIQQLVQHLQSPNPSGNVRIVVEATCPDEWNQWGKRALDTGSSQDIQQLIRMLQRNQRRGRWRSSILNFESDRTIQNVSSFNFTWDLRNPFEEEIGWNSGFGYMRDRFQDTLHSLFRIIEHQKQKIAEQAIALRKQGQPAMPLTFDDPMQPFKDVFSQLLGPKELVDPSAKKQTLEFRHNGQEFSLSSLSSGEREVVNIAFDFLLRKPEDCLVVFDEPELHLHPELSYRLIRALQTIGGRNQFFLCTHSPDVITSSLDNTVVFLSPAKKDAATGQPLNQAIAVSEGDETNQALKLLGHSVGIISLGKRIVLIEGSSASLDKQTYGSIIKDKFPGLVLVPSGGKHEIRSFATIHEKVLSRTIWGVEFFMLCDGDSGVTEQAVAALDGSRLRRLTRYHVENYFLDETVWESVFRQMEPDDSWLCSASSIRAKFRELAKGAVSYATALWLSAQTRTAVGNIDIMPRECHAKSAAELSGLFSGPVASELERVRRQMDVAALEAAAFERFRLLEEAIDRDTDDWKMLIPGKALLAQFANHAKLSVGRAKTLYIRHAHQASTNPFEEVLSIFQGFAGTSEA